MKKFKRQEALDYHSQGRKGKIEVVPTKPYSSQRDLALAYTPGVAEPCKEIDKNPEDVYQYTAKGNLVAVISNGSAVLGLGNLGPLAAKPVMEGKGLLFKIFADIDVFDIEVDVDSVDEFVNTVKSIAPTFGGINLEDIKAPECFEIERRLKAMLNIPVMHDDQHGTAIISGAALVNALEIAKKKIEKVRIIVNGAGAAAISCAKLYLLLGAKKNNIIICDSKGVIRTERTDIPDYKRFFATKLPLHTLEEAMVGADVFLGLSKGKIVSKAMIKSMAKSPVVFALANPVAEISYEDATEARSDIIMATGRSDNPNQVNNVLGFPFIFRGALDVRACCINEEMKYAAVQAIAGLAKEIVPDVVVQTYGNKNLTFGKDYIIPTPIDPRLLSIVAPAVAKAAMESGVAQKPITDWDAYVFELNKRLGLDNQIIHNLTIRAKRNPKTVVFAEADNLRILKAAQVVYDEGIAQPILLGKKQIINDLIEQFGIELDENIEIVDPKSEEELENRHKYGRMLFEKRCRRGYTLFEANKIMRERNYFGAAMVETGRADAMISGITRNYRDTIRPSLQIIGKKEELKSLAGMYIINTKKGSFFFADTTINLNPTVEELVDITLLTAEKVKQYKIIPNIALVTYSNFGSSVGDDALKMRKVAKILQTDYPKLNVDGEIQVSFALNQEKLKDKFEFSKLVGKQVNTLIFPNLSAGNIAYKLMQELGNAEAIGPILMGMKKTVHVLQLGSTLREIVNMVTIAVTDAQNK